MNVDHNFEKIDKTIERKNVDRYISEIDNYRIRIIDDIDEKLRLFFINSNFSQFIKFISYL